MCRPGHRHRLLTPWYSDQILPFDVTLAGANEYVAMAAARIFGLEILNEGTGHSIDDPSARCRPRSSLTRSSRCRPCPAKPGVFILPQQQSLARKRGVELRCQWLRESSSSPRRSGPAP
jgi:hypothetical protein